MSYSYNQRKKMYKELKKSGNVNVKRFGVYPLKGWDSIKGIDKALAFSRNNKHNIDIDRCWIDNGTYEVSGAIGYV